MKVITALVFLSMPFMVFSQNWKSVNTDWVTLKVDRNAAGAIAWVSDDVKNPYRNLVNRWDHGRYIQQSYYGNTNRYGPYTWNGSGWQWNPIEGGHWNEGRSVNNSDRLIEVSGSSGSNSAWLYTKARCANFGTSAYGDSDVDTDHVIIEKRIDIKYDVIKCVITTTVGAGALGHKGSYANHESPALWLDPRLNTIVSEGSAPYSAYPSQTRIHSSHWVAALEQNGGYGMGVLSPSTTRFRCDKHGSNVAADGPNSGTRDGTAYITPLIGFEFYDKAGTVYTHTFYIVMGNQSYIQSRINELKSIGYNLNSLSMPSNGGSVPQIGDDSVVFNASYYLWRHPDIRMAFGKTNYTAARNHWYNFVENSSTPYTSERRQGHVSFSVEAYRNRYPVDLQPAFDDPKKGIGWYYYFNHYKTRGYSEGRIGL